MDDENLEDIFDEYAILNNEREEATTISTSNEREEDGQSAIPPVVRKRIVRNPRPKLNAERLCGERGLPAIPKHFQNVKFKGKGHEKEDLDILLSALEHWAHRLFPCLKFADCLEHIEKLGKKKPVQVCMKKLRLDMPLLTEDFIHETIENDDVPLQLEKEEDTNNSEVIFDKLIQDHQGNTTKTNDLMSVKTAINLPFPDHNTSDILSKSVEASIQCAKNFHEMILTDEQKARIERNKRFAEERRKAKLAVIEHSVMESEIHLTDTLNIESSDIQCNQECVLNICDNSGTVESDINRGNLLISLCENSISMEISSSKKVLLYENMNTDEGSLNNKEAGTNSNDNIPVDVLFGNISGDPTEC